MRITSNTAKIEGSHQLNKLIEGCMEVQTIYGQESNSEFTKQFAKDLGQIKDFCIKLKQLEKSQASQDELEALFDKYDNEN